MNIFENFTKNPVIEKIISLNRSYVLDSIIFPEIIRFAETESVTDNIYKEYIINILLSEENILSYVCERCNELTVNDSLKEIARSDIDYIYNDFFCLNIMGNYKKNITKRFMNRSYKTYMEKLTASDSPETFYDNLIDFYFRFGAGEKRKYYVYSWENCFVGVRNHDNISLSSLYNIDRQKEIIIQNTMDLINNKSANNILLIGDSGAGKSSLVKAVVNEYHMQKLRLVYINQYQYKNINNIFEYIQNLNFKFIIFIDDLSFEYGENEYKYLKSQIEGYIGKQPSNAVFYATSNRRHLIKETFTDRTENDVHSADTQNEILSLSERFGIHLFFNALSKSEYIRIIEKKLEENNIKFSGDIAERAFEFALKYNGYSARCAEQFIKTFGI